MQATTHIIDQFLYLYKTQPHLFTEYQTELEQFISDLPAGAVAVSDAISDWAEAHPVIQLAMFNLADDAGRQRIVPKIPASNPDRDYGELVRNQIREAVPPPPAPPADAPTDPTPPTPKADDRSP